MRLCFTIYDRPALTPSRLKRASELSASLFQAGPFKNRLR